MRREKLKEKKSKMIKVINKGEHTEKDFEAIIKELNTNKIPFILLDEENYSEGSNIYDITFYSTQITTTIDAVDMDITDYTTMYNLWVGEDLSKEKAKELTDSIFQFFNI